MLYDIKLGDCMGLFTHVPDGSIDTVATDPPYGMDFQSNRSKSGPRHAKIANDTAPDPAWLPETYRVLKPGGALLTFCNWATAHEWREAILSAGFTLKSQVVWDRMHHGMGNLKGAFAPQHDVIWYATKGRRVFAGGRPKSVLRHQRPSPGQDFGHPTCKPVPLMQELIQAVCDGSRGSVLDPFLGSGSTGVATVNLARNFVGFELEPSYYETATARLAKACAEICDLV